MTQNLSAAQQTQLDNRDAGGQWKQKTHADVEDTADVLGIGSESSSEAPPTTELTSKFGNPAPATQQVIRQDDGELFTSYGAQIAKKFDDGSVELYEAWDFSQTTATYRNQFLGENKAQTQKKIDDGTYRLASNDPQEQNTVHAHRAGDYVESFEDITKNWPDSISVTSDSGPGGLVVTATHQPDMGSTVEFRAETDDDIEPFETGSWTYSVDGDVVAEGPLGGGEDEILTAEMYQDAFVGQAMDDDALSGMFDSLNQELGKRDGYRVSTGGHGLIDDHTERHDLRIDEPDGGAWWVIQLRHDPRVAAMDGDEALELYEAERGNRNYESEHYVSRIRPDGTTKSLESEESYESMDEAINEIRTRSNNFGISVPASA